MRLGMLTSAFVWVLPASALEEPDLGDYEAEPEAEQWKEQDVSLPAYPREENLQELSVDDLRGAFRYFLDLKSVSIGGDRVVRYTVVIASHSGARNVLFEGIRCATAEYKTYAYGTGGELIETQGQWANVFDGDSLGYRDDLVRDYVCDRSSRPRKISDIVRRARYGSDDLYSSD